MCRTNQRVTLHRLTPKHLHLAFCVFRLLRECWCACAWKQHERRLTINRSRFSYTFSEEHSVRESVPAMILRQSFNTDPVTDIRGIYALMDKRVFIEALLLQHMTTMEPCFAMLVRNIRIRFC